MLSARSLSFAQCKDRPITIYGDIAQFIHLNHRSRLHVNSLSIGQRMNRKDAHRNSGSKLIVGFFGLCDHDEISDYLIRYDKIRLRRLSHDWPASFLSERIFAGEHDGGSAGHSNFNHAESESNVRRNKFYESKMGEFCTHVRVWV